jgi:hypothetical protein
MSICFDHITEEDVFAAPAGTGSIATFLEERLERVQALLGERCILEATLATMEGLTPDPVNGPALLNFLREGIVADDGRIEIRSALRALARALQPRTDYDTLRLHATLWIPAFGAVSNPGPGFVHEELERVAPGFEGRCHYIDGNSHDVLPLFLGDLGAWPRTPEELAVMRQSESRPRCFDLVTVDGDHTAVGAWWDLCDVMPHVALGGAVVFDDLLDISDERLGDEARCARSGRAAPPPDLKPSLLDVWRKIQQRFPNFLYLERLDARPPLGIAIRMG